MIETEMQSPPAAAPASLWEDFLDIFYAPRQVFERRRNAGFGLVLLILTLLVVGLYVASQGPLADAMRGEFERGMRQAGPQGPQMTAEQMATAQRMQGIIVPIVLLIGFPLGVIISGLLLWGLGKLVDFSGTVKMGILILTYAQFPRILQAVVNLLQGLFLAPQSIAEIVLGPVRFMDPETTDPALLAFLMRVDLFYLWSVILIAIGAQVIGRVGKGQSYALAAAIWLIGAIPTVLPILLR